MISVISFKIHQALVCPGEGDLQIRVTSDLAVFEPSKDEVLYGKIVQIQEKGILVSLDFANCWIAENYLMKPSS